MGFNCRREKVHDQCGVPTREEHFRWPGKKVGGGGWLGCWVLLRVWVVVFGGGVFWEVGFLRHERALDTCGRLGKTIKQPFPADRRHAVNPSRGEGREQLLRQITTG